MLFSEKYSSLDSLEIAKNIMLKKRVWNSTLFHTLLIITFFPKNCDSIILKSFLYFFLFFPFFFRIFSNLKNALSFFSATIKKKKDRKKKKRKKKQVF